MTISATDTIAPTATAVSLDDEAIHIELSDGRTITAPIAWYPRLLHASPEERNDFRLTGNGQGIHWSGIDEDISVESVLAGRRSMEGAASLKCWLASRKQ